MTTGIREPGDFCWINVLTPDPAAARAFFADLLGWEYVEIPGMGHRIRVAGQDFGGLFDLKSPNASPGSHPGIGVMVKVTDVDAMAARVVALGGRSEPPFDIGTQGRMATCYDPNGANIDLWQPREGPGMALDSGLHGAPSWFETMTTDLPRAKRFYADLFGWTATAMPMPVGEYTIFNLGERGVAGGFAITPEMGAMPPVWLVYFTVTDIDASAARAAELGCTIYMEKTYITDVGYMVTLASPQGVMFYLMEYRRHP